MTVFDEPSKYLMRLILVLDFLLIVLSALSLRALAPWLGFDYAYLGYLYWPTLMLLCLSFCGAKVYAGGYRALRLPVRRHALIIVGAGFFALGCIFTLDAALFRNLRLDQGLMLASLFIAASLSLLSRIFIQWWYLDLSHSSPSFRRQVLMVGTSAQAASLAASLDAKSEWGVDVIGFVDVANTQDHPANARPRECNFLGDLTDLDALLSKYVIDEVFVVLSLSEMPHLKEIFNTCFLHGIRIKVSAYARGLNMTSMAMDMHGNMPILEYVPVDRHQGALFVKRATDLALVFISLPLLLPLFLFIAAAIKLDSKGPVFFTQARVGFRKRVFPMFKFRSMVQDAESLMKDIEYLNEAEGPNFKINKDPRVTRVGRVLRKLSLDELPQLLNVLLGQMTLVGPRPMSLRDVDLFDCGEQHKRFSVLPGLTCLWQISGRSRLGFDQWLALDLEYIDNWSLALDLKIFLKTFPVILKGDGAV